MTNHPGRTCDTTPTGLVTLPSGDQVVLELHRLGIRHLSCSRDVRPVYLAPVSLVTALAGSPEARLRGALVPLLLLRPDYATAVPIVAERLSGQARVSLVCAHSAAIALQSEYGPRLALLSVGSQALPDLFASELKLPPLEGADERLATVAERQAQLSGEAINWRGTYRHAVDACLRFADPAAA
jgi:hypothetical protein